MNHSWSHRPPGGVRGLIFNHPRADYKHIDQPSVPRVELPARDRMSGGSAVVETARSSQIGVYHSRNEPYDQWMESVGIPIHRGYAFDDMREIEVAPWDERGCNAAFLVLAGQEGIQETRITEIPPGASLPPTRIAMEEITY